MYYVNRSFPDEIPLNQSAAIFVPRYIYLFVLRDPTFSTLLLLEGFEEINSNAFPVTRTTRRFFFFKEKLTLMLIISVLFYFMKLRKVTIKVLKVGREI